MPKRIAAWLVMLVGLAAAAPAFAKTFVYVHDPSYGGSPQGPRIFGFELARSGELTPLPDSPVPVPGNAGGAFGGFSQTLDYSRKLKRLVAGGGSGVSVFDVGKDGALTLVPGSPFGGGPFGATALVEVGKRQFVYTGQIEGGADQLRGFEFLVGGGLAELGSSPFPGFPSPSGMRDRGNLLFVANADPGSISPLLVGPDGSLTAAQDPVPFEGVSTVAPDPKGKFLYEPSGFAPDLFGFRIDPRTGALDPLPEGAMASGLLEEAGGLAVGKRLVIAVDYESTQPGGLSVLRRARDGSLEYLGDEPSSGIHVCCPALDAAGRRLVTAGKQGVRVFAVRKDGSLQVLDEALVEMVSPTDVAIVTR